MNWYNKTIKLAAVRYMYHGTSINNLESILSEGLNNYHSSVYDRTFQNDTGERSQESFGGIYFTDNVRTALMSGYTASEKNKVETSSSVVVMVKMEDKTPTILIDEDQLTSPHAGIAAVANPSVPINLADWIFNDFPNIDNAVDSYLDYFSSNEVELDNRLIQGIRPYVFDFLKTFAIQELSKAISREDAGTADLGRYYPLENLPTMDEAIQNYRNASNTFMQKAHRITTYMSDDMWQNNMRVMEPISYRGKNRIVLVSVFNRNAADSEYNNSIDILHSTDDAATQQYLNDILEKYSDKIIMKQKDNIIYENKKENELV